MPFSLKCFLNKTIVFFLFAIFSQSAWAEYVFNLTRGVTPISFRVYELHMITLYMVSAVTIGVFSVMIWSIINHRKSKRPTPSKVSHDAFAEVVWTVIPIIIIIALAVPSTRLLVFMGGRSNADMTVKVTGYQWKWKYDYLDEDLSFFSNLDEKSNAARQFGSKIEPSTVENYILDVDEPIVLPIDTRIRILTTAADVIHAWWVPDLGWKEDAIPGYISENWTYIRKEGVYRGQCAELCGRDHAFMPIVLKAVSKDDYRTWVAETKMRFANAEIDGEKIYKSNCAACHQVNGEGVPGGVFPSLVGSSIVTDSAPEEHIKIVLNGKNLMPAFADQLSDEEIAAVISYERTSWGNQSGEVATEQVKALRSVVASQ